MVKIDSRRHPKTAPGGQLDGVIARKKTNYCASQIAYSCSLAEMTLTMCHRRAPEVTAPHRNCLLNTGRQSVFGGIMGNRLHRLGGTKTVFFVYFVAWRCCNRVVRWAYHIFMPTGRQKLILHRDRAFFVFRPRCQRAFWRQRTALLRVISMSYSVLASLSIPLNTSTHPWEHV